jgi:hypothetical protein
MQCKDIPDERVVELARRWQESARAIPPDRRMSWIRFGEPGHSTPGVVAAVMQEFGVPYKLALVKVESLCERKNGKPALLECGTSPNYAWPAYG